MRKFWGWAMLVAFILMVGIIRYNLVRAGGIDEHNWWKVCLLAVSELALLIGWYRLAIRKPREGANNAK